MDMKRIKRLRRVLTLHFAVIAWLTAMLVASGTGTVFLPLLIFFVSVAAFVFVDTLEWFELGRIGSYVGMTAALAAAIGSYVYSLLSTTINSEATQLLSVAGLLVYPEAVLFLQRKNLRVFEQLAVFLLLEMIVAALVNDNLLFGLLLAPIMLLWVSSLLLFCRYATLVGIDPSIEKPMPKLAELIFHRLMRSVLGEASKSRYVESKFLPSTNVQSSRTLRRTLQSIPIGMAAIIFAALFFYLLPRTGSGLGGSTLGLSGQVGLPEVLRMGKVTRLLQNPNPIMRVSFRDAATGENYKLIDPPYLRARVFSSFQDIGGAGRLTQSEWRHDNPRNPRRMMNADQFKLQRGIRDRVWAELDIRRQYAKVICSLPPVFAPRNEQPVELKYDRFTMLFPEQLSGVKRSGKSVVCDVGTLAFANQKQCPVTPVSIPGDRVPVTRELLEAYRYLLQGKNRFPNLDLFRQQLLKNAGLGESTSAIEKALFFEDHFVRSGEYTYTLDLPMPTDSDIDPVVDFVLNSKRGHCQYFATAMVMLLRQCEIPCRIVVGYRPTEYNRLGEYFLVRQSDAHAWVEVLCQRKQLEGTRFEAWLTDSRYYWVRFDPTPGVDALPRTIVEQQGQAFDYAEKLWKDYVVDAQKLNTSDGLYSPLQENSRDAYEDFMRRLRELRKSLESGNFLAAVRGVGFAWPLAVGIFVFGALLILVWRLCLMLPRLFPRLANRLGLRSDSQQVRQAFYARCLSLLEQAGWVRPKGETPREFTASVAKQLWRVDADELNASQRPLEYLTNLYYRLRFGEQQELNSEEQRRVTQALNEVESALRQRQPGKARG